MLELAAQEIGQKIIESNLARLAKEIPNLNTNLADLDKSMVKELAEKTKNPETIIDEKQKDVIKSVESGEKCLDNTDEKGNYGEMKVDQDLKEKGYTRISKDVVTSLDEPGHQGIDGIYYNEEGIPQYIVVDAKYNTAKLNPETVDGKQMSENWINKRLDVAVGKETADKIRMEKLLNPNNVESYVAHVSTDGIISYDKLDGNANVIEKGVKLGA